MNSFYGGKEGRSYAIIKHFDSEAAMITAFQKGAGYTEVNYGEYVIIDTISNNNNPNHPDNGKIYRRGINFTNDMGGAIYVGQIQGAEGKIAPIHFGPMLDLTTVTADNYTIVDEGSTFAQPGSNVSIEATTDNELGYVTNKIELGYKTYADKGTGENRKNIIGLDIPKPVVKVSAVIVDPTENAHFTHTDIAGKTYDYSVVNFANPIHQANLSTYLTEDGVQYYDYQIAIPKSVANLTIYAGSIAENKAIKAEYDTIDTSVTPNASTHINEILNVKVVDELRSVEGSDAYQYHLSGEDGWRWLGNPNGQFHIYTRCLKDDRVNPSINFNHTTQVESYLNQLYPYGIRVLKTDGSQYDLSQAGWVVAADIVTQSGSAATTQSSLYAFDYRTTDGESISTKDLASTAYSGDNLKGWFQVQQFESSFTSSPQQILLIGDSSEDSSDWGHISSQERADLQSRGLWLESESSSAGGKWWL